MRQLLVSCNVTVDGYMAGPDNGFASSEDFAVPDAQQESDLAAQFDEVADTIVIGHRTFLAMQAAWSPLHSDMANWINASAKVVLSRQSDLDVSVWNNSSLAVGDGPEQVQRLKSVDGAALVAFGGVETIRSLTAADLVDEYWLKVMPVAIGAGSSFFSEIPRRHDLTLTDAKGYPSGVLDLKYRRGQSRTVNA